MSEVPELESVAPSCASSRIAEVVSNEKVARDTFRLRFAEPELAANITPGQFVMIRPGQGTDPLLGRPLALYDVARDVAGRPIAIDVVYLVIGRGTSALSRARTGDRLPVWGPLGNGFTSPPEGPVFCVAGGIGQTPFLALAKWWTRGESFGGKMHARRQTPGDFALLYGARTSELLAGIEDFVSAGVRVEIATDDGTAGHHGFVTDLLNARFAKGDRPGQIIACGPPPMLAAVAKIASRESVPCLLSLENHMACGFGACFSCVAPILRPDGITDLRRVCVEGPIFPAESVVFS